MATDSNTGSYGLGYFVPMPISDTDKWRLPIYVDGDDYVVYVSSNAKRLYSDKTFPDWLKVKLTMLRAYDDTPRLVDFDGVPDGVRFTLYYELSYADDYQKEVGWRADSHIYIVMINADELCGLMNYMMEEVD